MVQRHHWGWLSADSAESLFAPRTEAWMADALCAQVDPELWYPEKGGSTGEAKRICRACPVVEQCLAYALSRDDRFGIWGGTSERERRKLKKATAEVGEAA